MLKAVNLNRKEGSQRFWADPIKIIFAILFIYVVYLHYSMVTLRKDFEQRLGGNVKSSTIDYLTAPSPPALPSITIHDPAHVSKQAAAMEIKGDNKGYGGKIDKQHLGGWLTGKFGDNMTQSANMWCVPNYLIPYLHCLLLPNYFSLSLHPHPSLLPFPFRYQEFPPKRAGG